MLYAIDYSYNRKNISQSEKYCKKFYEKSVKGIYLPIFKIFNPKYTIFYIIIWNIIFLISIYLHKLQYL